VSTVALRRPATLFAVSAVVIAASCIAILRSSIFTGHPDVMAWAVTFDLTITIPLLYYLVVVRTGSARPITVAPVFAIAATIAAIAIPRGYQQTLHDLRFIVAPLEVVTIILLVRRIAAMRNREAATDPLTRIDSAARHIFGDTPVAGFVASEVAVISYALFGWNRKPDVPEGARSFTVHETCGWSTVAACIAVVIVAESIGVHLLIQHWSTRGAWIMTALDFYGFLWILGDFNALRLRPSLIAGDVLHVRYGLRWSIDLKSSDVASIAPAGSESNWKRKDVLKVAMIDDPRHLIALREPLVARGIAGLRRKVSAIAISPDQDEVLTGWISDALRASAPAEPAGAARR
jgi:hypothetical protein